MFTKPLIVLHNPGITENSPVYIRPETIVLFEATGLQGEATIIHFVDGNNITVVEPTVEVARLVTTALTGES